MEPPNSSLSRQRWCLGVEPDGAYATDRLRLAPGDILLLYTDGLTEAMNAAGECFGTDRLLAASRSPEILSPRQLVEQVVAAVTAHVGTVEQSDDLTLLAVARLESGASAEGWRCLPAELERLPELLEQIQ